MTNNSESLSLIYFCAGIVCIIASILIIVFGLFILDLINWYILGSISSAIIGAIFFILGSQLTPDLRKKQSGDSVV